MKNLENNLLQFSKALQQLTVSTSVCAEELGEVLSAFFSMNGNKEIEKIEKYFQEKKENSKQENVDIIRPNPVDENAFQKFFDQKYESDIFQKIDEEFNNILKGSF